MHSTSLLSWRQHSVVQPGALPLPRACSSDADVRRANRLGTLLRHRGETFKPAARTEGSLSGKPINRTSWLRNRSFRASVVIGLRCPGTGGGIKGNFFASFSGGVCHSLPHPIFFKSLSAPSLFHS